MPKQPDTTSFDVPGLLSDLSVDAAPAEYSARIRKVNQAYAGLERHRMDAAEILRHKFAFAFWRARELGRLLRELPDGSPGQREALVDALCELRIFIPEEQQSGLSNYLGDKELFARLMSRQGVRLQFAGKGTNAAGPGVDLKISANRSSAWPFEKWRDIRAFSEYAFEGDGVHYRGVFFRPGDTVLCNVNLDGNGLYTALSDPKNFCSHSAVVVILEHDGRRFPAVIETYEKGLRAVPLNVFLGPRFSSYTEVYRHKALLPEHAERINAIAATAIRRVKGYNFDTEDGDRDYFSCTRVGRFLMEEAGLEPVAIKSRISHPQIQKNLGKMGYTFFDFFAPVDYLLNESLSFVGWIDNNQHDRLLARELVESRFRILFLQNEIKLEKLPFRHRVNLWGINQIRRRTLGGRLLSLVEGFDHISLPKGPDPIIAMVTLAEAQIGGAIKRTRPFVREYLSRLDSFDLHQVTADAEVRRVVNSELKLAWLC